jgi:hypothetical protein
VKKEEAGRLYEQIHFLRRERELVHSAEVIERQESSKK